MFKNKPIFWTTAVLVGLVGAISVLNQIKHRSEQQEQIDAFQKNISDYIDPYRKKLPAPLPLDDSNTVRSSTDSLQIDESLSWDQFMDQLYLRLASLEEQQAACLEGLQHCPGAAVLQQRQAAVNQHMVLIANHFKLDRYPPYRAIRLLEEQFQKEQLHHDNWERLREVNLLRKQYIEQLKKSMQQAAENSPS